MQPRRAFTMIELLVVLAILGILMAILIPAIQKARAAMARSQCANQVKQITLACHSFHDTHGKLPPAFGFFPAADIFSGRNGLGNVFFHLLPFVEQKNLYEFARHRPPPTKQTPKQQDYFFYTAHNVHQVQVPLFNCPSDPTLMPGVNPKTNYAPSSYAANYLVFGNVKADFENRNAQGKPRFQTTFRDGMSQTILFAEKYASASMPKTGTGPSGQGGQSPLGPRVGGCHWAYFQADCHNPFFAFFERGPFKDKFVVDPNAVGPVSKNDWHDSRFQVQPLPAKCNPCLPATGHTAMNVGLADGSVRGLTANMESRSWWALVTPASGDVE